MTTQCVVTQQAALAWLAEIFEEDAAALRPETAREAVPLWDSMGVLALMAGMDEKFGVVLKDSDIKNMRTIDDILAVLRKHRHIVEAP